MAYSDIVNGILSIMRELPEYNDKNTTYSDYKPLAAGHQTILVVFPDRFTSEIAAYNDNYFVDWLVRLELYVRYKNDPDAAERISLQRQAIIEQIAKYPQLNGTSGVLFSQVTRGDAPVPVFGLDGQGPFFWMQTILVQVKEDINVTALE